METTQIASGIIGLAGLIWIFKFAIQTWTKFESNLEWNVVTITSMLSACYLVVELVILIEKTPLVNLDSMIKAIIIAGVASSLAITFGALMGNLAGKLKRT